jgi:leucyl aminopeptidase (aminopeptidase T)
MKEHAKLASKVVTQCLNVKDGENVWIETWNHTIDLASKIALECSERGAQPFITLKDENYWIRSLKEAPKKLLETIPSTMAAALEHTDVFIFMVGPKKPVDWSRIPSEKQGLANVWYLESNKYLDSWRQVSKKHGVRTLGIEYCRATPAWAHTLGLSLKEWRDVMLEGCLADQRLIADRAAKLTGILRNVGKVSIETPFGTSLTFRLAGRQPNVGDSVLTREDEIKGIVKFLPSGFVELAPDEETAEGIVVYDVPTLKWSGRRIEGLKLRFSHGAVVEYSADSGSEAFEDYLNTCHGDSRRFGFFGLGLNPGLRHGFTQDDKVLGSVTLGIGGNEDKNGKNRTVGNRHWWAAVTRATVKLDEETILKDGNLMV